MSMGLRYANLAVASTAAIATLIGLSAVAEANDRGVRGTVIPAPECTLIGGSARLSEIPNWTAELGGIAVISCPLPINNIDLGSNSNDNDITKFRVLYRDSDGAANQASLAVSLLKSKITNGTLSTSQICNSTLTTTATGFTASTINCPQDVAGGGTFYRFLVVLVGLSTAEAEFAGIDFP
jgi:hypothetical protein